MTKYDYIIAGAGAAGLSLVMRMIDSGRFDAKKILVVDKAPKTSNDRTWCFWEKDADLFEPIVHQSWRQLWVHHPHNSICRDIAPYSYKLIRGIDFYNFCFAAISRQPNIDLRYGNIETSFSDERQTGIVLDGERLLSDYVFSSIAPQSAAPQKNEYRLLQHFKGWFIKSPRPVFDPASAVLMDFRTDQRLGTAFIYVMPFSTDTALVEYTLFSESVLQDDVYNRGLDEYLRSQLHLDQYTVLHEETGVIPMTNIPFPVNDHHIVYLGSAGGQTKPSSGYTFRFIQKHSKDIVDSLIRRGDPFVQKPLTRKRFDFYDSVLLNILANRKLPGDEIFWKLFLGSSMSRIMKFLDNETSVAEEFQIIRSLPAMTFLKAAIEQIKNSKVKIQKSKHKIE